MDKEKALYNFIETIKNAWTYERMTEQEKRQLERVFERLRNGKTLHGNYAQRIKILNDIYYAFLLGLNYTGYNWRENGADIPQF